MKRIIILLIGIIGYSTINGQQVRDLKYFHTDNIDYYPNNLFYTRKYYKDINNYFTPFLGQWKSTTGNQTLIITLWKETKKPTFWGNENPIFYCDEIFGHYQIYQDYGLLTQSELYSSQINIGNTTQTWDTIILADAITPNVLSGVIHDVNATPLNPIKYPQGVSGLFSLIINSSTSPLTAQWHIGRTGFTRSDQPKNFIIPKNVTLTKM